MTFFLATPRGSWEELRSEQQCQDAASVNAGVQLPSWVPSHPSCSIIGCSAWKPLSSLWKAAPGVASWSCGWRRKRQPLLRLSVASLCPEEGETLHAPCRLEAMEGQVIGGMLRLFHSRLPRLRAGLDWTAHFLFSRVTLSHGAVSSLKCFFLLFHIKSL